MSSQIVRRLKPEEEELLRKRDELAAIRTALAERELELVELRRQLAAFEGRYLREVGTLYAELDEWKARISELRARSDPSPFSNARAEEAREQAKQTYTDAHGAASKASDLTPSPELKSLFREAAKRIHPDLCKDSADLERRTRLMAEANRCYQAGDMEGLQRILEQYDESDTVKDAGIGAELIRIIRQISLVKNRLSAIERELAALGQGEIALLRKDAEKRELEGRDLLADLAASVREQIERAKKEHEALVNANDQV